MERDTLTGDWGGTRSALERRGIHTEGLAVLDYATVASGGLKNDGGFLSSAELELVFDLDRLLHWRGARALVYGLHTSGIALSAFVGDSQGTDNIEADAGSQFYEAWIQQNLWGSRLSFLGGLYDINSEFDVIQSAGLFLNSSHGIGAEFAGSGLVGPSIFPFTALGLRAKALPRPWWYLQALISDGVPGDPSGSTSQDLRIRREEGALIAFEAGYYSLRGPKSSHGGKALAHRGDREHIGRETPADYDVKLALGLWSYTSDFTIFRPAVAGEQPSVPRDAGAYALADWRFWRDPQRSERVCAAFFRVGWARTEASRFANYVGMGVTAGGFLFGRSDDSVGLAIARATNSDLFQRSVSSGSGANETTLEVTYRAALAPWWGVQPNAQWVIDPNSSESIQDALVLAIRTEIAF